MWGLCRKSNSTQIWFFGLSNSPFSLKKKERVKFREFRWFGKKNLVSIWLKVESIQFFFLTRKKSGLTRFSTPKLGGPDSQSRCGLMMMLRRACTMQLQLPPHDDGDGMKPRLERHGILYQPILGVGIKVGGPARLLPTIAF